MILTEYTLMLLPSSKDIDDRALDFGVSHYIASTAKTMRTHSFSKPLVVQNCATLNTLCHPQRLSATTSRHLWSENNTPSSMFMNSQALNNPYGISMLQMVSLPRQHGSRRHSTRKLQHLATRDCNQRTQRFPTIRRNTARLMCSQRQGVRSTKVTSTPVPVKAAPTAHPDHKHDI